MKKTGRIKVPRGQSSREIANEEKGEFLAAYEIEKKTVREENGVVKNSKEQELDSRKSCQKF